MKLICSKANLLKGVNIVSKAVPTRTTMAILECILIDASANEIKLIGQRYGTWNRNNNRRNYRRKEELSLLMPRFFQK